KATGRVFFQCNEGIKAFEAVEKAIETGEAQTATFHTTGKMEDGTIVSEFEFTWSFKQRSKP
ncbi:MAG: thioesterase, partial [Marinoscillum sp.]